MAGPTVSRVARESEQAHFIQRFAVWIGGYLLIVAAWGAYNAWPLSLIECLVFFPIHLALAGWLYHRNQFPFETAASVSEWDALIAFLILAIGVASGFVVILAIGWVGAGAVFLRPTRPETAWDEWFKLPLLFMFSFPIGMELAGSRLDWLQYVNVGSVEAWPMSPGPLPVFYFQAEVWLSVYALIFWLSGAAFWLSVLLWPAFLVIGSLALRHTLPPGLVADRPELAAFGAAAVNLLVVAALIVLGRRWSAAHRGAPSRWRAVSHWARLRSRAPWLAALVIVLQQSSLVEGWLAGREIRFNAAGAALLAGLLLWFRWRERGGPIGLYTRILLASSLFVLLAAEWTDREPLRNLSLGLLLVGLCSWRRDWNRNLILAALLTWTLTIPASAAVLYRTGLSGPAAATIRAILFVIALSIVVATGWRKPSAPASRSFDDHAWQPVKRFGFILLSLLLGFQLASAFWRERGDDSEPRISLTREAAVRATARAVTMAALSTHTRRWRVRWRGQDYELIVSKPEDIPSRVNSPERLFDASGWRVVRRRLIAQPGGQAAALQLRRSGESGAAVFWFENGGRAFVDYLRARRILWSGWNLAHRDLRLVLVHVPGSDDPEAVIRFAQAQDWFRDPSD